ncbi:hypothetical protein WA026_016270 [Henosepilachna vigintioctopunctata]|uniref:Phlebovirus glycoprotein G2 fusion domain-containing protein n=1 Tax=Henosepilachna vigintioctopunctata TaxID=420089 RepID=A0AAW1UKX0_9CUCU
MRSVSISMSDTKKYISKGARKTGCECDIDKCTGSASACCLGDEMNNHKEPKRMGVTFYYYAALARQSCTSEWECNIENLKVQPIVSVRDGKFKRMVEVYNKRTIEFNSLFYREGTKFNGGTINEKEVKPHIVEVSPRC